MSPGNLVSRLSRIATGDSFLVEHQLPLDALRVAASGIPIGSGTAPTSVVKGVSFANSETAILNILIPQDYAENKDELAVRLVSVASADATETTVYSFTTTQTIFRDGAVVDSAARAAVTGATLVGSGPNVHEDVLDLSGSGFKPGDVVQLVLSAAISGGESIVAGLGLIYGSTLRAYNDDDNERAMGS